jgi:hypothetical protein
MTLKQTWQKRNNSIGSSVVKQKGFCIRSVLYTTHTYCASIQGNSFVLPPDEKESNWAGL